MRIARDLSKRSSNRQGELGLFSIVSGIWERRSKAHSKASGSIPFAQLFSCVILFCIFQMTEHSGGRAIPESAGLPKRSYDANPEV